MHTYAALLRGVNVGKARKLAMDDLRALLEDLGCADVRTYLRSGNAVLRSPLDEPAELEERIEVALRERLGLPVRCLVRTGDEMRVVVAGNTLGDVATDGARMLALFLSAAPDPALLVEHDPRELDPDTVRLGDRVIYQWCPDGFMAAPAVGTFVERRLGVAVTARNWNTVTGLAALLEGRPGTG